MSIESLRPVEGSGDGQGLVVRSENLSTPVPQPAVGVPIARVRRGRWRVGALVATAALLLVGLVWFAGSRIESPAARAAKAAAPVPSVVTADVERRVLSESLVTRGDVKPSGATPVVWTAGGGSGGVSLVTGVPVKAGGQVVEGQAVVEVSGRPMLAIAGTVPVYRDLRPGLSGKDVAQLQAALGRLGFSGVETDGVFGPGTKAAVAGWYERLGYKAPVTSADASTQLAAAQAAVVAAKKGLVDAQAALTLAKAPKPRSVLLQADAALGLAQRGLDQAKLQAAQDLDAAGAELTVAEAKLVAVQAGAPADIATAQAAVKVAKGNVRKVMQAGDDAVTAASDALDIAQASHDELVAVADTNGLKEAVVSAAVGVTSAETVYRDLDSATGAIMPAGELVVVPRLPARVDTVTAVVGARADGTLVSMSIDSFVVESLLSPGLKPLVQAGAVVKIDDELSGVSYTGKIMSVADELVTPKGDGGGAGQSGYLARVETDTTIDPKLLGTNVRVTITGQTSGGEVLVVPVAAVFAQADGTNQVTRVAAGVESKVKIETGLAAAGFVTIKSSTPELKPGDKVIVSR